MPFKNAGSLAFHFYRYDIIGTIGLLFVDCYVLAHTLPLSFSFGLPREKSCASLHYCYVINFWLWVWNLQMASYNI